MNNLLITVVCLNNQVTYIFRIEEHKILEEDEITICGNKIIEETNNLFNVNLKSSDIHWGIVNEIKIKNL